MEEPPPAVAPAAAAAAAPAAEAPQPKEADRKILADLDILLEKMDLCDTFLRPAGGTLVETPVYKSDEVLEVIGFLEACAPRIIELVEAAAQGALSEQVLEKCLLVNDRLTTNLSDIDAVELTDEGAPAAAAEEAAEEAAASKAEDDFDAFLSERSEKSRGDGDES